MNKKGLLLIFIAISLAFSSHAQDSRKAQIEKINKLHIEREGILKQKLEVETKMKTKKSVEDEKKLSDLSAQAKKLTDEMTQIDIALVKDQGELRSNYDALMKLKADVDVKRKQWDSEIDLITKRFPKDYDSKGADAALAKSDLAMPGIDKWLLSHAGIHKDLLALHSTAKKP